MKSCHRVPFVHDRRIRQQSEDDAEYHPSYFDRCAIDAGTSRHTAAVFFQVRSDPNSYRPRVTVFADYHAQDVVSLKNACAVKSLADQLPCHGRIDQV